MFFEHIKRHEPTTGREEKSLDAIKAFIDSDRDNLFSRTNLKGHITASAWVVNPEMTKTVLVHHKKLDKWVQPGGHADGSEDILGMARQEVWEETGLKNTELGYDGIFDVDAHTIPEAQKNGVMEPAHTHFDVRYLLVADGSEDVQVSDESHEVKWAGLEEAKKLNPEMGRMIEKTIKVREGK